MKDACDQYRAQLRKFRTGDASQEKINTLLEDLLEKEDKIALYKNRLKELEAAFYYNLELISERDLELSVLEKQLAEETDQLEEVSREKNQLEDLIKAIDEKNCRKIQQLETKLTLKENQIRHLQRENFSNISALKGIIDDLKQQEENELDKINNQFETQKKDLIRNYQQQIEKQESYYLLEIDNLTRKLDQASTQKDKLACAEEEIRQLKHHLENVEKVFLEKENYYLERMSEISKSGQEKVDREVQCGRSPQRSEKTVQAEPDTSVADCQTSREIPQREQHYVQKISFLQEQNEVLKFIIKDLKKSREGGGQSPGCECFAMRADVEQVKKHFQTEISNLKKILETEFKARAEEDAVIQSVETSLTCLKDKALLALKHKFRQLSGDDIFSHLYDRQIQNQVQLTLLDQKLSHKLDSFIMLAEQDKQKLQQKLDDIHKECFCGIHLPPQEESRITNSENFRETGPTENKIHADMLDNNRCVQAPREDSPEVGGFLPARQKPKWEARFPHPSPRKRPGETKRKARLEPSLIWDGQTATGQCECC